MLLFEKSPIILAPMAGVSDVGFREIASTYGADACESEMLSARAMLYNSAKTAQMTIVSPKEKIKIGQIFGHEEKVMTDAIKNPLLDCFDIIDINMGCPAPKIVKNEEGSALMKNLPLAYSIISSCKKATNRPLGVKFRLGYDRDISLEFGKMCEDAGADYITLHARTTVQNYSGRADLDAIARLKAGVKIKVVGNGDVTDRDSYLEMLKTGVDGVMVGRGALGRPWIFASLKNGREPTREEMYKSIVRHVEILRQHYDEEYLTLYLRKHFLWYTSGLDLARDARLQLATSPSIDKSLEILQKLFL